MSGHGRPRAAVSQNMCRRARQKPKNTHAISEIFNKELGLSVKIRADPTSVAATGKPRPQAYVTQKLQL